jgi:F-type H+-transporting ATPase subunit epsilon
MIPPLPTRLRLTLVTRDRKLLDVGADMVELPGSDGYLGILPGHTPLLATLKIGVLSYTDAGREHFVVLSWGFAEVLPDRVIVLAEMAYAQDEIDLAAAERERIEAERELATLSSLDEGFVLAQGRLEESVVKIQVAEKRR